MLKTGLSSTTTTMYSTKDNHFTLSIKITDRRAFTIHEYLWANTEVTIMNRKLEQNLTNI
jgi:hypothetical protein